MKPKDKARRAYRQARLLKRMGAGLWQGRVIARRART